MDVPSEVLKVVKLQGAISTREDLLPRGLSVRQHQARIMHLEGCLLNNANERKENNSMALLENAQTRQITAAIRLDDKIAAQVD